MSKTDIHIRMMQGHADFRMMIIMLLDLKTDLFAIIALALILFGEGSQYHLVLRLLELISVVIPLIFLLPLKLEIRRLPSIISVVIPLNLTFLRMQQQ